MRLLTALFLFVSLTCIGADRCSLPPGLEGFVNSLPADNHAKREAAEKRLKQGASDFTLHRIFLDASVYERKPIREQYQQLLATHPDDLDYQYLQGRSLVGSDTKQALQIYARILAEDPEYPWVHVSQLEIFASPAFRDRAKFAASFSSIQRICPALLQPYWHLNEISDNNAAARSAPALRRLLNDSKTPSDWRLYSTLWAVEFRIRPASEHDAELDQVAADLKRLLPFDNDPRIQPVIENGARLTGDKALEQRMKTAQRKQNGVTEMLRQNNAWYKEHANPTPSDSIESRHAFGKALLAKSEEWHKLAPDNDFKTEPVRALIYMDAPPDEIGRAVDEVLALVRQQDGRAASWIVSIARPLLDAGLLLDRIDSLCTEAISRMSDPEATIEIDLAPNHDISGGNHFHLVAKQVEAMLIMANLHEKQGDREGAHRLVWQASDFLASRAPAAAETSSWILQEYAIAKHGLLQARAEMAEREGRKLDALNFYRETLAVHSMNRYNLLARERKLWLELGGTEEGWQEWTKPPGGDSHEDARQPAATANRSTEASAEKRALPPLNAKDAHGDQWTLDRFAGKTVIAVVWATWCEPCRAELPYFAKLAGRLKGRNDVIAISFNTDNNVASGAAFAKSYGYTFPVLFAKQYAEDLMAPSVSIPRTWIIRDGAIVKEYQGFGSDGDQWVAKILAAVP